MVSNNCFLNDKDKLENKCCFFKDRHALTLFLLNIILNIQKKWINFCKCDGKTICLVCQANICYREYEYIIYKNCLNLDLLAKVRENLVDNLDKMLTLNNHFICEVINDKFQYEHKDWFTNEKLLFDLEKCLKAWEENKMQKIMSNDFRIVCKNAVCSFY